MTGIRISAAILTRDEERNIGRCLDSVAWVDEIVVLDSGSTDRTCEIAAAAGARVHYRPFTGFRAQRTASLDLCTGDWILFLDADEWVTPELAGEIRAALASEPRQAGFYVPRRNRFLDRWMDHSWGPDRLLRLYRRGAGRLVGYEPHTRLELDAGLDTGHLEHALNHAAYDSVTQLAAKADRYSTVFADADATDSHYAAWKMIGSPALAFVKTLLWKQGFREGAHGFVVAAAAAWYHFLKYAKKWQKLRGVPAVREVEDVRP